MKLEPLTPECKEQNERADQLRKLLEDAVIFYRHQLTQTEPGLKALAYLDRKTRYHSKDCRNLGDWDMRRKAGIQP